MSAAEQIADLATAKRVATCGQCERAVFAHEHDDRNSIDETGACRACWREACADADEAHTECLRTARGAL